MWFLDQRLAEDYLIKEESSDMILLITLIYFMRSLSW